MTKGLVLIVGAGKLGSLVVDELKKLNFPVRVLLRDKNNHEKAKIFQDKGAEIVYGSLQDKKSLEEAVKGVSTVISMYFSLDPSVAHKEKDLVDVAKAAGVTQFFPAAFGPKHQEGTEIYGDMMKGRLEDQQYLFSSGLPYTVLHTGPFLESWTSPLTGFDYPNAKALQLGDASHVKAYISYPDLAKYIAHSVENKAVLNKVLLVATENLSNDQVIKVFERETGKKFEVTYKTLDESIEAFKSAADPQSQLFPSIFIAQLRQGPADLALLKTLYPAIDLSTVYGVEQHAKALLKK